MKEKIFAVFYSIIVFCLGVVILIPLYVFEAIRDSFIGSKECFRKESNKDVKIQKLEKEVERTREALEKSQKELDEFKNKQKE